MDRVVAVPRDDLERPDVRLGRLLAENARPLERIAASYGRTRADRDDLLQEIAAALWTALPRFRGDCSEKTFVMRVAHNRALTFLTKRGVQHDDVDDHADRVVATSGANPAVVF